MKQFLENASIVLFRTFPMIACNPEWWFVQYAPVFLATIFG